MNFLQVRADFSPTGSPPPDFGAVSRINLDPAGPAYRFTLASTTTSPPSAVNFDLSPATRDVAGSDQSFDRYNGIANALSFSAAKLVPGAANPSIGLTYSGMADLLIIHPDSAQARYLSTFGLPSTAGGMPASGNTPYTGIVIGYARAWYHPGATDQNYGFYRISGTASFALSANGASDRRFDGTLTLTLAATSGTPFVRPITTLTLRYADVANPRADGVVIDTFAGIGHQGNGTTTGQFYGPKGEEFAAPFTFRGLINNEVGVGTPVVVDYAGVVLLRRPN